MVGPVCFMFVSEMKRKSFLKEQLDFTWDETMKNKKIQTTIREEYMWIKILSIGDSYEKENKC